MRLFLGRLATSLIFLLLLCASLSAQPYVLDNRDHLLIPKSVGFVELLSSELFSKTGYSLYVAVVDKTPESNSESPDPKAKRAAYKSALTRDLPPPYALIVFMKNDSKIDILSSDSSLVFDKKKVYDEYMVPLLPRERDEILSPQRISAVVINGYSEAADMIAKHFQVQLVNNLPVDERGGREFVRFCMYAMLLGLFGVLGFIFITRRRRT